MRQFTRYTYLGVNGMLETPILLEGIYSIKKIMLCADDDKVLTKNGIDYFTSVTVPENEISEWKEIEK